MPVSSSARPYRRGYIFMCAIPTAHHVAGRPLACNPVAVPLVSTVNVRLSARINTERLDNVMDVEDEDEGEQAPSSDEDGDFSDS